MPQSAKITIFFAIGELKWRLLQEVLNEAHLFDASATGVSQAELEHIRHLLCKKAIDPEVPIPFVFSKTHLENLAKLIEYSMKLDNAVLQENINALGSLFRQIDEAAQSNHEQYIEPLTLHHNFTEKVFAAPESFVMYKPNFLKRLLYTDSLGNLLSIWLSTLLLSIVILTWPEALIILPQQSAFKWFTLLVIGLCLSLAISKLAEALTANTKLALHRSDDDYTLTFFGKVFTFMPAALAGIFFAVYIFAFLESLMIRYMFAAALAWVFLLTIKSLLIRTPFANKFVTKNRPKSTV